ncbi:MAG: hypothetical protein AAFX50_12920, partial [Acidobacteriota bacterium]
MRRLTQALYALATLTALLGVAALVHGGRRAGVDGVDGVLTALGQLVRNAGANSAVWTSALGWGLFTVAARYFEGTAPLRKPLAPESPTDRPIASRDDHPAAVEQRRGEGLPERGRSFEVAGGDGEEAPAEGARPDRRI